MEVVPKSIENRPRVFFHSRYDGASLAGTHMDVASGVLEEFFDFVPIADANFCLLLDLDETKLRMIRSHIPNAQNRFLIVREPRQVHPSAHSRATEAMFHNVFRLGTFTKSGSMTPWPYTRGTSKPIVIPKAKGRADAVVAIASWRVSFIEGGLYDLRAEAFSHLEIDTFGRGWDAPVSKKLAEVLVQVLTAFRWFGQLKIGSGRQVFSRPLRYLGEVRDKQELLSRYRVSVVIENSQDYMSEKVLDALTAGTIPVYVGPDLKPFGIPDSLVVKCQPRLESVSEGIELALQMDYETWRRELETWMQSDLGSRCLNEVAMWRGLCQEIYLRMKSVEKRR